MLRHACRLSTAFATATKRHEIARLLEAYRGGVNFYVGSLWQDPGAFVDGAMVHDSVHAGVRPVIFVSRAATRRR